MAPEYINNGVVSKKQDVFAFGVVLLQTIFRGCAKVDFQDYYYRDADSKWVSNVFTNIVLQLNSLHINLLCHVLDTEMN